MRMTHALICVITKVSIVNIDEMRKFLVFLGICREANQRVRWVFRCRAPSPEPRAPVRGSWTDFLQNVRKSQENPTQERAVLKQKLFG